MALTRSKFKLLQSLRQKKFRNQYNLFLIEGEKIVSECLNSDWVIQEIFLTEDYSNKNQKLVNLTKSKLIDISFISSKDLERISSDVSPQGILALVENREFDIAYTLNNPNKRFVLLDGISDPGNLGTIIRSADWFGMNGIFLSDKSVEAFNPKVIKASMGSIFHLPIFENCNLTKLIVELKNKNCKIFSADIKGESVKSIKEKNNYALIFGNESLGLSDELKSLSDSVVTIPSKGKSESLNVAIAASIIFYEMSLH
ncbi:MAG: RNA methyltransferase [Ignavibacteria bacterium]|nr:RNA methyltransferase [Ignavibacteria bacterium]